MIWSSLGSAMRFRQISTPSWRLVPRFTPLSLTSLGGPSTPLSGAGTQHKVDITEWAINVEKIYSVIVPQSWTQKAVRHLYPLSREGLRPYSFYGGRKAKGTSRCRHYPPTDYVAKYKWSMRRRTTLRRPSN